jgi:hypothetical protein
MDGYLLRPFPASEFPSPFYFLNLFFPFLFPLLYLPEFPFSFLPSIFSLSGYSQIMSLIDLRIIMYLTIYAVTGSRFHIPSSSISILHPKIHDLHYDHWTYRAPKYLISPILGPIDHITTLSLFSTFLNRGFSGWRVHKNSQILIALVCPRHPRAFPNMHLRMV